MLKLLSYNHLFTYALLFVATFALRAPSFHPDYFQEDESFYLVAAERIVDGGAQYVDTWDNKPPLIVWVYSFFVWVFGPFALLAIRIFTCLYLFLSALYLNQFVNDNRLLRSFSLLPAFLLIFLSSVPWYAQELNGEILMNFPIIFGVVQLLRLKERSVKNFGYLFLGGILLGLAFMVKYQGILLFAGLVAAYFSIQTPRLSETFSFFMGFGMAVIVVLLAVYFTGALEAFWDVGVVYNLDYIRLGRNPGEEVSFWFNLGQYGQLWGMFLILGLIGLANFRLNYFTNSIRLRKVETVTLFWFSAAMLTIIIGGGRLYLHYFYLLVPPLAIYISKTVELKLRPIIRNLVLFLAFLIPMYTYGVFLASAFEDEFSFIDPYISENGWIEGFRKTLNDPHPLTDKIEPSEVENGILVLAYEPTIYTRLDFTCATKYTNFSIANFKMEFFEEHEEVGLISATEHTRDVYLSLKADMPDCFVDPQGLFPVMQENMPLLLKNYKGEIVDEGSRSYYIYKRQ